MNMDFAVEQRRREGAKVENKGLLGISSRLQPFTWHVKANHPRTCRCPASSSRLRVFAVHIQLRDLA
jgi:hypothetical protein